MGVRAARVLHVGTLLHRHSACASSSLQARITLHACWASRGGWLGGCSAARPVVSRPTGERGIDRSIDQQMKTAAVVAPAGAARRDHGSRSRTNRRFRRPPISARRSFFILLTLRSDTPLLHARLSHSLAPLSFGCSSPQHSALHCSVLAVAPPRFSQLSAPSQMATVAVSPPGPAAPLPVNGSAAAVAPPAPLAAAAPASNPAPTVAVPPAAGGPLAPVPPVIAPPVAGVEVPLAVDSAAANVRPGGPASQSSLFLLSDLVGTWSAQRPRIAPHRNPCTPRAART